MADRTPLPNAPASPPEAWWAALESSVVELESALARGGQGVSLLGLVLAAHVTLFVSHLTGFVLGLVSGLALAWYTVVRALLVRGHLVRVLRLLTPVTETVVPIVALWILAGTEGAEYALGSWVPPQLLGVFLAGSILRLDPKVPLLMGALSAAMYAATWFVLLRPAVGGLPLLLYRTDLQLVRVFSLFFTGVGCSLAVVGLRRVVARASARVRSEELFGKYRLGREIASGGMGRVHEALYCPEGGFQRRVAVKLIHPHLATDPEFVRRFREEAELGARLAHPNVVSTLDFGRFGETYFLAMEFVDGLTLAQVLSERRAAGAPLSERLVAFLGQQVASGLEHAHQHALDDAGRPLRVVHRDLSPSNLLVDRAGRVRITDFGVARALGDTTRLHTELVGKPSYVAPEALEERGVDPRADLWALGVILWEMLAHRRLFTREGEAASLLAVLGAEIPAIGALRPDIDPMWETLFGRLLVRDRDGRLSSATELREALEALGRRVGAPGPAELAEIVGPPAAG